MTEPEKCPTHIRELTAFDCPRCQGEGEIEDDDDYYIHGINPPGIIKCFECGGSGDFWECQDCLDEEEMRQEEEYRKEIHIT